MNNNNNVFYNARSSQNEESLTHTHNKNAKRKEKEKEKVARSPSPNNNNAVFYSPTDPSLTHNNNNETLFDAENIHNKIAIEEKEKKEKEEKEKKEKEKKEKEEKEEKEKEEKEKKEKEEKEKEEKESREKESKERVARLVAQIIHNNKIRNEIIGKEKNRMAVIKTARNAFRAGKNKRRAAENKIRNERTKKRNNRNKENKENKENTINISSLFANNAPVNVKVKLTQNQINQETIKSPEYIKLQSEFEELCEHKDKLEKQQWKLMQIKERTPNIQKDIYTIAHLFNDIDGEKVKIRNKIKQLIQAKRDEEYFRNKVNTTNKVNTINTEKVTQVLGTSIPVAVIISILIALL